MTTLCTLHFTALVSARGASARCGTQMDLFRISAAMVLQAELRKRTGTSRLESQEKVSVVFKINTVNVRFVKKLYYVAG